MIQATRRRFAEERFRATTAENLGFFLLCLSEDTVKNTSRAIDRICALARTDQRHHDLTLAFGTAEAGLTIHCNEDSTPVALSRLRSYCERRKYKEAAPRWFRLCMDPKSNKVRFGVSLSYPWIRSDQMDAATKDMQAPQSVQPTLDSLLGGKAVRKKVGRNDPCPCGSGLKYKKCCLRQVTVKAGRVSAFGRPSSWAAPRVWCLGAEELGLPAWLKPGQIFMPQSAHAWLLPARADLC